MNLGLRAAVVQLTAPVAVPDGIAAATPLIERAVGEGAALICLPENAVSMTNGRRQQYDHAFAEAEHPAIPAFAALADHLGVHLAVGSLTIRLAGEERLANRSFLFGPDGAVEARYDKIHMFDAEVGAGERYRESDTIRPGTEAVLAPSPWGAIGLTICYDLRFPYLYRTLAQQGARLILVPAAFTVPTGRAHWQVLLRARAIETGCFVLAAAQTGSHDCGRKTWGHSLIVAPWGEVLADVGEESGIALADLDLSATEASRQRVPSLYGDRAFVPPEPMPEIARNAAE